MGRRRKEPVAAVEAPAAVRLQPCPKCGLRLSEVSSSLQGVALHDCREVQRLRKLETKRQQSVPLEQQIREQLAEKMEMASAKELAQVLIVLERNQKAAKGTGPSDALRALLVH